VQEIYERLRLLLQPKVRPSALNWPKFVDWFLTGKGREIQPVVAKEEAAACDDLFNFRSLAWRPAVVLA